MNQVISPAELFKLLNYKINQVISPELYHLGIKLYKNYQVKSLG